MAYFDIILEPPLVTVVQLLEILRIEVFTQLLHSEHAKKKLEEIYNHFYNFFLNKRQNKLIPCSILKQLQNMPMIYTHDKSHILIPAMISFGSDEI